MVDAIFLFSFSFFPYKINLEVLSKIIADLEFIIGSLPKGEDELDTEEISKSFSTNSSSAKTGKIYGNG